MTPLRTQDKSSENYQQEEKARSKKKKIRNGSIDGLIVKLGVISQLLLTPVTFINPREDPEMGSVFAQFITTHPKQNYFWLITAKKFHID